MNLSRNKQFNICKLKLDL